MTPLARFVLYALGTAIALFISPLLRTRFPLNVIQGGLGERRALLFPRILFSSLLFGGIFGLFCGSAVMAIRLLLPHLFSK
jgi:hypothetical protein